MSSNYKQANKSNGMNPQRRNSLSWQEKQEILTNTQEWQVVGHCPRLPTLDPEERKRLIRSKGYRR